MNRSFDILAREYRPMLLAYLRSLGADPHLAEDLAQETYVAAYKSLSQFDRRANFGAWLRGIARNKALMHWRSSSRKPLTIDSRVTDGVEEVFEAFDRQEEEGDWWETRRAALRECIDLLSEQLRAAVGQVYEQGATLQEAASILKSTRAAIGQRLSRARNQIRSCVTTKLETAEHHE